MRCLRGNISTDLHPEGRTRSTSSGRRRTAVGDTDWRTEDTNRKVVGVVLRGSVLVEGRVRNVLKTLALSRPQVVRVEPKLSRCDVKRVLRHLESLDRGVVKVGLGQYPSNEVDVASGL